MSREGIMSLLTTHSGFAPDHNACPRIGVVTSVDCTTATARVLLQPEGVLSGWLPIMTLWAGAGWGMICPPTPGDQVLIIFQENDAEHGIVVGSLFSNSARPPECQVGEFLLRHQSGASIRLLNSGIISIHGDLHVSGDVYDAQGSLSRLRNHYDVHTHRTGNGTITSIPDPLD